jgi:ribosome-binding factor A
MSKIRQQRTADQIQQILSEVIARQLRDPRLHDLTVTKVAIDRELQYADVYVHALGDDSRHRDVLAGLTKAAGYLRHELAGRMRLRTVPHLNFHWDPSLAHAEAVYQILDGLDIPPEEEE